MEPEKLSDSQLYLLAKNKKLPPAIAIIVQDEIAKRGLSEDSHLSESVDDLKDASDGLPGIEKFLIVLFPFMTVIHAIIANRHISRGKVSRWRQHWRYVTIGFLIWLVILIIFCIGYRIAHAKDVDQFNKAKTIGIEG